MRNIIPTITPAPPRVRRKRRAVVPPVIPAVTVMEVQVAGTDTLLWRFSAALVLPVSGLLPELQAADLDGSGWVSPIAIVAASGNHFFAQYSGVTFDDGANWQVLVAPAGLSFVGGGALLVPGSGSAS